MLCFALLHFADIEYLQIKGLWQHCMEISAIFPIAFTHFVSLAIFLLYFKLIIIITFVISNIWCYYCNCFKAPQIIPIWDSELKNMCMFWLPHQSALPSYLFLFSGLSIFWDAIILKLSQLITLQCPKCLSKGKKLPASHFKSKARNN